MTAEYLRDRVSDSGGKEVFCNAMSIHCLSGKQANNNNSSHEHEPKAAHTKCFSCILYVPFRSRRLWKLRLLYKVPSFLLFHFSLNFATNTSKMKSFLSNLTNTSEIKLPQARQGGAGLWRPLVMAGIIDLLTGSPRTHVRSDHQNPTSALFP